LARSEAELEKALHLAAVVFRPNEKIGAALCRKRLIMSVDENLTCNDVVILVIDERVVATCFLIERQLIRGDQKLASVFLSSICVDQEFRGRGLSKMLIDTALAVCHEREYALAFVIARRSVDYFYTQFGFYGISQYAKAEVYWPEARINAGIKFEKTSLQHLDSLQEAYQSTYLTLNGAFVRKASFWLSILDRCNAGDVTLEICKVEGRGVAYVASLDGQVLEMACTNHSLWTSLVETLVAKSSGHTLTINCSPEHPVVRALTNIDVTISRRQCLFGGHMVKILSPKTLLDLLHRELGKAKANLKCPAVLVIPGFVTISSEKKRSHICIDDTLPEWEKAHVLMGAESITSKHILAPWITSSSFNIPYFDQV